MLVVMDTNVLVSGLLGLYTYPARVVDLLYIGRLQCVYDDRIMAEYQDVLSRPKFHQVISEKERRDLLGYLMQSGRHVLAGPLGRKTRTAPDPDDVPFFEVAVTGRAERIVTGNQAHFAFFADNPWGIRIVSPRECFDSVCEEEA